VSVPEVYCPVCGGSSEPGASFCGRCGSPLPSASPKTAGAPLPPSVTYRRWDGIATGGGRAGPYDVARDRTRTGLLLMILDFGIGWIPYVSLVGGLLGFIGIIFLWLGRRGFGARHHRYVSGGCLCVVVGLLTALLVVIGVVVAVVSSVSPTGNPQAVGATLRGSLETLFVVGLAAGAVSSLGYVLLPYALADRGSRRLLWTGYGVLMIGSVLVLLYLLPQLSNAVTQATAGPTLNDGPIQAVQLRETLLDTFQVIPNALFFLAYLRVRRSGPAAQEPPAAAAGLPSL
jgi:hypothetical protein